MGITGPIMQFASVVPDCVAAAQQWIERLGVGPFFIMDDVAFQEVWFRGKPCELRMSVAIAYSGNVQIEFVQPLDRSPSMLSEFLAQHPEGGMQHVGVISHDLDADIARLGGDSRRLQWGTTAQGMRFAYMDTQAGPASVVELIEANDAMLAAFTKMREASIGWDGSRPLRGQRKPS
jgi:hypothetical protein